MTTPLSRRRFTRLAGASLAAPFVLTRRSRAEIETEVGEAVTISPQSDSYHGWPTVARLGNGDLVVTCSGRRRAHVCPFGAVEMMRSRDDGETWSFPRTVHDGPIDDRDSGVLETAQGSLLVTSFSSLAYQTHYLEKGKKTDDPDWLAAQRRLPDDEARQAELGVWGFRSTDGGVTFSERIDTVVSSPHGPCQLRDGRLLYAGKQLWTPGNEVGAAESDDDGLSWRWLAPIPARKGDDPTEYHEPYAAECPSGKLVAQVRNHNANDKGETLQTESDDGGQSWTPPRSIGVWGLPSHLLVLRDGRLLMTYGHRREPFGCQARISEDEGATWSEPIVVYGKGAGRDLGYPSSVEFDDGSIVTVWYEKPGDSRFAQLRLARWQLNG